MKPAPVLPRVRCPRRRQEAGRRSPWCPPGLATCLGTHWAGQDANHVLPADTGLRCRREPQHPPPPQRAPPAPQELRPRPPKPGPAPAAGCPPAGARPPRGGDPSSRPSGSRSPGSLPRDRSATRERGAPSQEPPTSPHFLETTFVLISEPERATSGRRIIDRLPPPPPGDGAEAQPLSRRPGRLSSRRARSPERGTGTGTGPRAPGEPGRLGAGAERRGPGGSTSSTGSLRGRRPLPAPPATRHPSLSGRTVRQHRCGSVSFRGAAVRQGLDRAP